MAFPTRINYTFIVYMFVERSVISSSYVWTRETNFCLLQQPSNAYCIHIVYLEMEMEMERVILEKESCKHVVLTKHKSCCMEWRYDMVWYGVRVGGGVGWKGEGCMRSLVYLPVCVCACVCVSSTLTDRCKTTNASLFFNHIHTYTK